MFRKKREELQGERGELGYWLSSDATMFNTDPHSHRQRKLVLVSPCQPTGGKQGEGLVRSKSVRVTRIFKSLNPNLPLIVDNELREFFREFPKNRRAVFQSGFIFMEAGSRKTITSEAKLTRKQTFPEDIAFSSSSIIHPLVFIFVWKYRNEVQQEKVNHN